MRKKMAEASKARFPNPMPRLGGKGQGGLEYLLLIGGAVLVVAVVIIIMIGGTSTGKNQINASTTSYQSGATIGNTKISQEGEIALGPMDAPSISQAGAKQIKIIFSELSGITIYKVQVKAANTIEKTMANTSPQTIDLALDWTNLGCPTTGACNISVAIKGCIGTSVCSKYSSFTTAQSISDA